MSLNCVRMNFFGYNNCRLLICTVRTQTNLCRHLQWLLHWLQWLMYATHTQTHECQASYRIGWHASQAPPNHQPSGYLVDWPFHTTHPLKYSIRVIEICYILYTIHICRLSDRTTKFVDTASLIVTIWLKIRLTYHGC